MKLSNLVRGGALAAFLLTATTATAQQQVPVPVPLPAEGTLKSYRAKEVLGMKIALPKQADPVGTVDDLVFDEAGNMEYMIVETGGRLFTVPFDAAQFDPAKKMATLPLTVEQYKVLPTYTSTTYPTFYAPAYRTEIYKHYGLTPRDLRIFRRR